jgi:hypothetical protein
MSCVNFHNHCLCLGCIGVDPSGPGGVGWANKQRMTWQSMPCAIAYNVYRMQGLRMTDSNHDGVADDYGDCYQLGLDTPEMVDPTRPPTGMTNYYQVTSDGSNGESTMGTASNGEQRFNRAPCP